MTRPRHCALAGPHAPQPLNREAALDRLKPDPIPAIFPVPEYAAQGRLAAVYARTRQGLGVPWMGVVAMAFAHYPTFYDRLWAAMEPLTGHACFDAACRDLRREAETAATRLAAAPLTQSLEEHGYDLAERREILACNTVFSDGNMPYVLMATLARLLLEGHDWTGTGPVGEPVQRPAHPKPPLMEEHHAAPTTRMLFGELKTVLGLPFVNTDYRAFARWPSYFDLAWQDLRRAVTAPPYAATVAQVHSRAVALALDLPNPTGLDPDTLRKAASADAPLDEVLQVVQLFQWLLPGLAVNVAHLRAQLMP